MRLGQCLFCQYTNENETILCSRVRCPLMAIEDIQTLYKKGYTQTMERYIIRTLTTHGEAPAPEQAAPASESHFVSGFSIRVPSRPDPAGKINPAYYHGDRVMCIIEEFGLDFLDGTILKYLLRAGHKPTSPAIEDYKKAAWYLARKIANLEK